MQTSEKGNKKEKRRKEGKMGEKGGGEGGRQRKESDVQVACGWSPAA